MADIDVRSNQRRSPGRRMPRILLGVALLIAGIIAPAAGSVHKAGAGTLGMEHEHFSAATVVIHRGQTLRLQNDSRWVHIIGAGRGGHLESPRREPVAPLRMLEQNDSYVTGPWTKAGTYYLTCSVHPEMTVKVVVTR